MQHPANPHNRQPVTPTGVFFELAKNVFNPQACCEYAYRIRLDAGMIDQLEAWLKCHQLASDNRYRLLNPNQYDTIIKFVIAINALNGLRCMPPEMVSETEDNLIANIHTLVTNPINLGKMITTVAQQPFQTEQLNVQLLESEGNIKTLLHNTLCTYHLLKGLTVDDNTEHHLGSFRTLVSDRPTRPSYLNLPDVFFPTLLQPPCFDGLNLSGADFTGLILAKSEQKFQHTNLCGVAIAELNPNCAVTQTPKGVVPRFIPNLPFVTRFINDNIASSPACVYMAQYCCAIVRSGKYRDKDVHLYPDVWLELASQYIYQHNKKYNHFAAMAFMVGVLTTASPENIHYKYGQFHHLFTNHDLRHQFKAAVEGAELKAAYTSMLKTLYNHDPKNNQAFVEAAFNDLNIEVCWQQGWYFNKKVQPPIQYPPICSQSLRFKILTS